ncbi:DUF6941 family protein [Rhodococcus pyridinivorans]|uniref:DUF6941 family protein n=1 Tax=Rhodococcus pyridinivorans TaxID=103816 RepID=UPI003AAEF383
MLSTFLLVQAATVTEGMVNVLSGGVTRLARAAFPARMDVMAVAMANPAMDPERTQIEFTIVDADDPSNEIAGFGVRDLYVTPQKDADPRVLSVPLVIDLRGVVIPRPGTYLIRSEVDGEPSLSTYFQVVVETEGHP